MQKTGKQCHTRVAQTVLPETTKCIIKGTIKKNKKHIVTFLKKKKKNKRHFKVEFMIFINNFTQRGYDNR